MLEYVHVRVCVTDINENKETHYLNDNNSFYLSIYFCLYLYSHLTFILLNFSFLTSTVPFFLNDKYPAILESMPFFFLAAFLFSSSVA